VTDQQPPGRIKDIRVYRDSFIGMTVLACIPFLIFGALPVYGWWAAIGMFLVWALILFQGTREFMPRPRRVIWLSVFAFAIWLAVVLIARAT
jgi:hypothetical protein